MPTPEEAQSVLWRRLDQPGHESARLFFQKPNWHLVGTAVFAHDQRPCRLDYQVICNSGWQTLSGKVKGWIGDDTVDVELLLDSLGHWWLNGKDCPEATGCLDLDLNFSPSTNVLPIRRLGLAIGEEAQVRAAWLRFPSFVLEPLDQLYRRLDVSTYRYESGGGKFAAELQVNAAGLPIRYSDVWRMEAGDDSRAEA